MCLIEDGLESFSIFPMRKKRQRVWLTLGNDISIQITFARRKIKRNEKLPESFYTFIPIYNLKINDTWQTCYPNLYNSMETKISSFVGGIIEGISWSFSISRFLYYSNMGSLMPCWKDFQSSKKSSVSSGVSVIELMSDKIFMTLPSR